ncbi:TorF family putative porin [Sphingoaurantiacus capsulatus]|uniref:TorF family putative porin n=1 Tax=Sphingoaurantiacus capsulatus TaxID=1771310 RepID=A0ABV7XA46_9SPHN
MKNLSKIAALLLAASSMPALAQEEASEPVTITGSATVVSQYRFRGISLSDEEVAIQGGFTAAHESGFYAGTWGSSLAGFGSFGGANAEIDVFAGYGADLGGATLDVGLLWYLYPGTDGTDIAEPYASITAPFGNATAKFGVAYSPKQDSIGSGDNLYVFTDLATAIPDSPVKVKAHLGYSTGDSTLTPTGDYLDWLVGVDLSWKALTFGVAYVDTNITSGDAAAATFDHNIVDSAVIFSLSAAF